MNQSNKIAKIKWACRRGMLELDFILDEFLNDGFKNLTQIEQDDFQNFLTNEDPDLFAWLMGFRQPDAEEDIIMVNKIRGSCKL